MKPDKRFTFTPLLISCGILLNGCSPFVSKSEWPPSPETIGSYLEQAYSSDFTYISNADIDVENWVWDKKEEDSAVSAFLFEDENGISFTAVAYRTKQMVGSCPVIKENYRTAFVNHRIQEISEKYQLYLTQFDCGMYDTNAVISVSRENDLAPAMDFIMEALENQPVLSKPDIDLGWYPLLWYSRFPEIRISYHQKELESYSAFSLETLEYEEELERLKQELSTLQMTEEESAYEITPETTQENTISFQRFEEITIKHERHTICQSERRKLK